MLTIFQVCQEASVCTAWSTGCQGRLVRAETNAFMLHIAPAFHSIHTARAAAGSFLFPSHLIELCFKVFCLTNVRSALTWPLGLSFWFSIGIYKGSLWERLRGGGPGRERARFEGMALGPTGNPWGEGRVAAWDPARTVREGLDPAEIIPAAPMGQQLSHPAGDTGAPGWWQWCLSSCLARTGSGAGVGALVGSLCCHLLPLL